MCLSVHDGCKFNDEETCKDRRGGDQGFSGDVDGAPSIYLMLSMWELEEILTVDMECCRVNGSTWNK